MTKIYDGKQKISVTRPSVDYVEIDVEGDDGRHATVRLGRISLKNLVRALLQLIAGD